jgi:hypothetical protein
MRGCDLDTTGVVWLYRPAQHKTAHRGKTGVIAIGPRCQEVIAPFLKPRSRLRGAPQLLRSMSPKQQ